MAGRRTTLTPALQARIVAAVRAGLIEVVPAVDRLDGADVVLADAGRISPDVLIAATGFRPGLERLVGHLGVLDERGYPVVHGSETHPAAPGLYFVGISVELGGLLRRLGREARDAARAIAEAKLGHAGAPLAA